MKIKDLIDKLDLLQSAIDLKEERIKLLEDTMKKVTDALEKRAKFEEGQDWESRYYAADEINKDLKKRLVVLEEAHSSVLTSDIYNEAYAGLRSPKKRGHCEPGKGIPHEHKEVKK